tara:strand:- start:1759 stop:3030 length:1272 start_codon:yes stop_codon:yes gene_type:complete
MAARKDAANQVIPTAWVLEAQNRWRPEPPEGIPMCAMGVDASGGGDDPMIIACRHDGWFAPMLETPGREIPLDSMGRHCAGIVVANRRQESAVIIDMGGGYGGSTFEHLRDNRIDPIPYKGAEKSMHRTADRQLGFTNKRSQAIWQFREALDPNQDGGSPIALPDDPALMADLTAPTFEVTPRGIKVETKEDVIKRLGRSTDRGDAAVTITGSDDAKARMKAVDRFQDDPSVRVALCNIIAGGVGITLTAGTHVIFQDLDWVPANHAQAEDRCYRMGQDQRVTVEYFHANGTLDSYIGTLLEQKMALIAAVEADEIPNQSILAEIQDGLRQLAPALMEEARAARATGDTAARIDALANATPKQKSEDAPLLETGSWEFTSSRDPSATYQVTFGRAGHLECSCPGFTWRGNCKHVREVREKIFD